VNSASRLLEILDRQCGEWASLIREAQVDLQKSGRTIKYLQPAEDAVVTVEATDLPGGVMLSLGFPFPLASAPASSVTQDFGAAFAVDIRRTGAQVAAFQHELLADAVAKQGRSLNWREVASLADFRERAKGVLDEPRQLAVFADQFTYLGDAIQHLAEWDALSSAVTARESVATSCIAALRGMLGFDICDAREALSGVDPDDGLGVLLVIPCWVDSHWPGIVDVMLTALESHPRSAVIVPGSNLIVEKSGRTVVVHHLAIADYRLSDLPVEQSMPLALGEFQECPWPMPAPQRRDPAGAVLIAPFSSHHAKNLTAVQLTPLVARLREVGVERVLVVSGDPRDTTAAAEFDLLTASLQGAETISPDLAEAIELVASVRFVVAADSSLAHAARRLNTPSVTIYNEPYWDGDSMLGLLHRSVVGFGTANPTHHHLVTSGNFGALTPTQCETITWLAAHSVGAIALPPQTARACREFAALTREGDALQIVDAHENVQRQARACGTEWLAADLPLRRLLRPFTEERSDRMAQWLGALTIASKLGSVSGAR